MHGLQQAAMDLLLVKVELTRCETTAVIVLSENAHCTGEYLEINDSTEKKDMIDKDIGQGSVKV